MLMSNNLLSIQTLHTGEWWLGDPRGKYFKAAERAIEHVWKQKPLYIREGGTIPIASFLERKLGACALHLPMGQNSDAAHLRDERIRIENLLKGKEVVSRLLHEVASIGIEATAE